MQVAQQSALLQKVRLDVDALLREYFEKNSANATLANESYGRLWRIMSDLGNTGGKRLRPYMTVLAYQSFGGEEYSGILPIAAAQELSHLCMLIHDDIIDRDFVRYGKKNVTGNYIDIYEDVIGDESKRLHYANSAALIAGDLALSSSYELVLLSSLPSEHKILAQEYLSKAMFAAAGGELLDTESVLYPMEDADALQIAQLKTASYSFVGPLLTGAALAGANKNDLTALASYGDALGIAFQLADDILGVFGDPSITGKSNTSDISEGKRTVLMQQTLLNCSEREKVQLRSLLGKIDITDAEAEQVRAIIVSSGAKDKVELLIDTYVDQSKQALGALSINSDGRQDLIQLIHSSTKRVR